MGVRESISGLIGYSAEPFSYGLPFQLRSFEYPSLIILFHITHIEQVEVGHFQMNIIHMGLLFPRVSIDNNIPVGRLIVVAHCSSNGFD